MSEAFLGEIRMFSGNYAPQGWAFCNGQTLNISQNEALYSLLSTTYGGDGVTSFGLPDLRGRVPIGQGQSVGGPTYVVGQVAGSEEVTLTTGNLPVHTHPVTANSLAAEQNNPANAYWASGGTYSNQPTNAQMNAGIVSFYGGNQPHENMMPYQVISFIIATIGIYPTHP